MQLVQVPGLRALEGYQERDMAKVEGEPVNKPDEVKLLAASDIAHIFDVPEDMLGAAPLRAMASHDTMQGGDGGGVNLYGFQSIDRASQFKSSFHGLKNI